MVLYYQEFPPETITSIMEHRLMNRVTSIPIDRKHQSFVNTYVKQHRIVLLGSIAFNMILLEQSVFSILQKEILNVADKFIDSLSWGKSSGMDLWVHGSQTILQVVSDIQTHCQTTDPNVHIHFTHHEATFFLPEHIVLYYNKIRWLTVYQSDECLAYNIYNGFHVGTIHSLLRFYLSEWMTLHRTTLQRTTLARIIDILSWILLRTMSNVKTRHVLLNEYVTTCSGNTSGVITLKRKRQERRNRNSNANHMG